MGLQTRICSLKLLKYDLPDGYSESEIFIKSQLDCSYLEKNDVIEGQMTEVKGVGRRRTQVLDDLREREREREDIGTKGGS
jgi:hypothetical protein